MRKLCVRNKGGPCHAMQAMCVHSFIIRGEETKQNQLHTMHNLLSFYSHGLQHQNSKAKKHSTQSHNYSTPREQRTEKVAKIKNKKYVL